MQMGHVSLVVCHQHFIGHSHLQLHNACPTFFFYSLFYSTHSSSWDEYLMLHDSFPLLLIHLHLFLTTILFTPPRPQSYLLFPLFFFQNVSSFSIFLFPFLELHHRNPDCERPNEGRVSLKRARPTALHHFEYIYLLILTMLVSSSRISFVLAYASERVPAISLSFLDWNRAFRSLC